MREWNNRLGDILPNRQQGFHSRSCQPWRIICSTSPVRSSNNICSNASPASITVRCRRRKESEICWHAKLPMVAIFGVCTLACEVWWSTKNLYLPISSVGCRATVAGRQCNGLLLLHSWCVLKNMRPQVLQTFPILIILLDQKSLRWHNILQNQRYWIFWSLLDTTTSFSDTTVMKIKAKICRLFLSLITGRTWWWINLAVHIDHRHPIWR